MKKQSSYKIALCGVISALSLVFMFLTGIIPMLSFTLPAIAGIMLVAIVIEFNIKWALLSYICVGIISIILAPDKQSALLFIVFFGYYPIIKAVIEKIRITAVEWLAKLSLFNIVLISCYFIFKNLINIDELFKQFEISNNLALPIIIILANVFFILYDIALTGVITYYYKNFKGRFFKGLK